MIVAENLEWRDIYFIRGTAPKGMNRIYAITSPPSSGWALAFVLTGEKRSTIFSPYTFQAFNVPNTCAELETSDGLTDFTPDHMRKMLEDKWEQFQRFGHQVDYDTCALVMRRLGWKVPAQVLTGGGEDTRKKGGKEVSSTLLKSVKEHSKRGKFLRWFLEDSGSHPVREAMAEFSMTRSNVLSYLYLLQKDHGIGYVLVGDTASVMLPDGCVDPFNKEQPEVLDEPTGDDDDSWLD